MLPIFSIGNLITFLAVLLILVILRALDRNNRSLEKLKRFSDKITANISALMEEKTAQLRELTVDLQGSVHAGKDLIARARTVEEALQARSEEVTETGEKAPGLREELHGNRLRFDTPGSGPEEAS